MHQCFEPAALIDEADPSAVELIANGGTQPALRNKIRGQRRPDDRRNEREELGRARWTEVEDKSLLDLDVHLLHFGAPGQLNPGAQRVEHVRAVEVQRRFDRLKHEGQHSGGDCHATR